MSVLPRGDPRLSSSCAVCNKPNSTAKCGRCRDRSYCSVKCQKAEWGLHKLVCALPKLADTVALRATAEKGMGVFAKRAVSQWSVIGVDRALFALYGIDLSVLDLTYALLTSRPDPVQWLADHCFTIRRAHLPPGSAVDVARLARGVREDTLATWRRRVAGQASPTLVTVVGAKLAVVILEYALDPNAGRTETADTTLRIVYEYQFMLTDPVTHRSKGLGLFPVACILNHSCEPNTMWLPLPGGECYLVAIRPIPDGHELTVSYRGMMDMDRDRDQAVWSIWDLCNGAVCRCGAPNCIHNGMNAEDASRWTPRSAYSLDEFAGATDVVVSRILTELFERSRTSGGVPTSSVRGACDALTQLLLLCGVHLISPAPSTRARMVHYFLGRVPRVTVTDMCAAIRKCVLIARARDQRIDGQTHLNIALLQFLLPDTPIDAADVDGVPRALLDAFLHF